jgi:HK97 family phage portal protein
MLVESFLTAFSALTLSPTNPKDPAIAKILNIGKQNTAGVQINEDRVMALPAIKRAVQIITDKMFGLPFYVFNEKVDGREFNRNHKAWKCVNWMANEEQSAPSFRQTITQWAMTWGNGCAWIDRSDPQLRMYPLLPDRTRPIRLSREMSQVMNGDDQLAGKLFIESRVDRELKLFDYSDVFHIRGLGSNGFWGWDIFELLAETFGGAIAKEEFSNRFFSNGANPTGFITMDGSLDEEDEETYMASLSKAMTGLGKSHKLILLEEGAKFQAVTVDPMKSQMLEGKQFDVRLLAMAIGIKVHKLVDGANSAFASLEQANHEHKDDDIIPWVNKFRVESDRKLLDAEEGESGLLSIDVDDEQLDWVPFVDRAKGAVELHNNGLLTKDEARRKVNYGPSKSRRAKDYRIPANIVYEDDAAMIPTSTPTKAEDHSDVVAAYLEKIEKRVMSQAKAKAKTPKEFLGWLDSLEPEEGPASIQPQINELYSSIVAKLNTAAETYSAEELANAI